MAAPKQAILAPLGAAPHVGLLASFATTTPKAPDGKEADWYSGISFQPELCAAADRENIDCGSTAERDPPTQPTIVEWTPYMIWTADECSTLENGRDSVARARRALDRCRSSQIEAELWTGALAKAHTPDLPNGYLASPASDVLSPGTGLTPLEALACLEQGLGQTACGTPGVIHATRQTVTHWAEGGALIKEGTVVRTVNGTIVVPGAGYDGSDPDGNAASAGAVWAYATGPIVIHAAEMTDRTYVQPSTNVRTSWAEQLVMAYWDRCTHLAVQIDLDPCAFAGAGS